MERVFVDATGVFSFYQHEVMYSGVLKILAIGREKVITIDERSDIQPNAEIFETLEDWEILDTSEYAYDPDEWDPMGLNDFSVIDIDDGEVQSVEYLEWRKQGCHCACGKNITHEISPIPYGYGALNQGEKNNE